MKKLTLSLILTFFTLIGAVAQETAEIYIICENHTSAKDAKKAGYRYKNGNEFNKSDLKTIEKLIELGHYTYDDKEWILNCDKDFFDVLKYEIIVNNEVITTIDPNTCVLITVPAGKEVVVAPTVYINENIAFKLTTGSLTNRSRDTFISPAGSGQYLTYSLIPESGSQNYILFKSTILDIVNNDSQFFHSTKEFKKKKHIKEFKKQIKKGEIKLIDTTKTNN